MALVKKCRHPRAGWDRCSCAWYADVRVAGKREYHNLGPDKRKARRKHDALMDEVDAGRAEQRGNDRQFDGLAKVWLRAQSGRRAKTVANYTTIVQHLIDWFGSGRVDQITAGTILDFEADLWERELAPGTVRNIRRALLAILSFAHGEGLRDPAPKLPSIKDAGRHVPHLSPPEAAAALAAAQPAHRLLYWTGLRAGELLGLRWGDIDFEASTLKVERQFTQNGSIEVPKSKASTRIVDLSEHAISTLQVVEQSGDRVFPVGYHTLLRQWHGALKAVGFEQSGLHILRHSNVALRLAADPPQDLMYIAEQVGHRNPSFTLRVYGHLIRRPGQAAGLDAAFRALSSPAGTQPR